jgi:four helix bundle protein
LWEVETLFVIAERIGYVTAEEWESIAALCSEVGKLLAGLRRSLTG